MVGKKHFFMENPSWQNSSAGKTSFFHQLAKIIFATENQVRNVLEFDRY